MDELKTNSTMRRSVLFVSIFLVFASSQPGWADKTSREQEADQAASEFLEYGYDRMKRFAVAYMLVTDLQAKYDPQFRKHRPKSSNYQKLLARSDAEMEQAITSTGLSVASYNAIAEAVSSDRKLAKQITKMVKTLGEQPTDSAPGMASETAPETAPETVSETAGRSSEDIVDLGTMEVQGFQITKSLIDAEVQVALKRPITTNREDDYLLICRDSATGTNIKRRWCAYNGDLARSKRQDAILVVDPFVMRWKWERFYDRLPD